MEACAKRTNDCFKPSIVQAPNQALKFPASHFIIPLSSPQLQIFDTPR